MPEELPASALKRRLRLQPARYANIEAGNLLRRIQADEGIAMLTTNLRHDLYPAFL